MKKQQRPTSLLISDYEIRKSYEIIRDDKLNDKAVHVWKTPISILGRSLCNLNEFGSSADMQPL